MDVKKTLQLFRDMMENHFHIPGPSSKDRPLLWASPSIGCDDLGYYIQVLDQSIPFEMSIETIRLPDTVESIDDIIPYVNPFWIDMMKREYRDQLIEYRELWDHEEMMTEEELVEKDNENYIQYYVGLGVPINLI